MTIFLRKIQITRSLSDLDLLEVLNTAGADLLSQTMQDQSETGVISKAALQVMLDTPPKPKMQSKYPRPVGNDVHDLAEHMDTLDGSFPDSDPVEERQKEEAFNRWFEDQELESTKKQQAFDKAMRKAEDGGE